VSKSEKKFILILIVVMAAALAGTLIYKKVTTFNYKDHLDEVIISVDNSDLTLREFGYYIYMIEDTVQDQAHLYDAQNPLRWWNTHFSAGPDSQYVSEYARKSAVNTCLSHEIYYKEALAEGIDLTPEEKEAAEKAASDLCAGMTEIQLERTGLTEDIIYNLRYKQELAAKYARSLAERVDFTVYEDGPEVELSGNGDFFQDVVLPRHQVSINNDLVDNVNMGRMTVNLDQE
jgi:hypothetical protein